jgi:hypothetical protein
MARERRPISVTSTARRPTLAERKKLAEMLSRGQEAWHRRKDGTVEPVAGAAMPRTTFTKSKQTRPSNTVDLDTYKARAYALRMRQNYRRR